METRVSTKLSTARKASVSSTISASPRYDVFDTAIGLCGIAWNSKEIINVQLPSRDLESLKLRLEVFGEPGDCESVVFVSRAVRKIRLHLAGKPQNFEDVPIDLRRFPQFHQNVYRTLQKIPTGSVTTYGDLAGLAGSPLAARAVGQAMAKNQYPIIIPCHRVLSGGGKLGGFSSFGGLDTKVQLLEIESGQTGRSAKSKPLASRARTR
jgi:methylated-DNA-[protein]-cysteine S-methyltransferase